MTAPSWAERDQQGRDAAWTAWRRIGVEPFEIAFHDSPTPHPLLELAGTVAKAMVEPTMAVMNALDADLDQEATNRILVEAASNSIRHVPWSIVEAIAHELARTDPVPFSPPPAGAWVRSRYLPRSWGERRRPRLTPEWSGMWHVFSGDFSAGDQRSEDVYGRSRCGRSMLLRSNDGVPHADYVLADELPGVDACRRCQRAK
jgi:hypothetical protein